MCEEPLWRTSSDPCFAAMSVWQFHKNILPHQILTPDGGVYSPDDGITRHCLVPEHLWSIVIDNEDDQSHESKLVLDSEISGARTMVR